MNRLPLVALAVLALATVACEETPPTSVDPDVLPPEPITVEAGLSWDEFGGGLQVFPGFGSASDLGSGVLAEDFEGVLDARTLGRFAAFPRTITVRDSTGGTRADSLPIFRAGRVGVVLDPEASTNQEPVTVTLGALSQVWDPASTTWERAVDTIGDARPWGEPGAGSARPLGEMVWDPAENDTVYFPVDSAQLAEWRDTTALDQGIVVGVETPGERIQVQRILLSLDVESTLDPDTVVSSTVTRRDLTFIYSPVPEPPPDGIRIGGTPSWRTVLQVRAPETLTGPPALCERVGCPVAVDPDQINYAALVFRTRAGPPAFQPTDTVNLDVRPVLAPEVLPKSPLGASLTGSVGRRVGPNLFAEGEGAEIEIPVTEFIQDQLRGETATGENAPVYVALLSTFEPLSIAFASFHGPGSELEPRLKIILTTGATVELP